MTTYTNQDETGNWGAATLYVCGKCGRTADSYHIRDWLVAPRVDTAEAQAEGWMVVRCPEHATAYARRIAGLPQRPRKASRPDYTQYVHEFTALDGSTRYAVARWDETKAQYIRPLDHTEATLTGCSAEFHRRLTEDECQNYATRREALARARYLFRPEYPDID